jgi:hypothetical protein
LLHQTTAYARGCDNLGQNKTWQKKFDLLNQAYENKDFDTALQHAKDLEKICELSPILNYTIAYIYKSQDDDERYLFYLQKATQNTDKFLVEKELLDQMWSEKYVAAHPDASPETIKARNEALETLKKELEASNHTIEAQKFEIQMLQKTANSTRSLIDDEIKSYRALTWTGAGIGIGGLVFAGVGAALVAITEPCDFKVNLSGPYKYTENITHSIGLGLIGAGSALTITGAIIAGIYGYKYKRIKDNAVFYFSFSPTQASVSLTF